MDGLMSLWVGMAVGGWIGEGDSEGHITAPPHQPDKSECVCGWVGSWIAGWMADCMGGLIAG